VDRGFREIVLTGVNISRYDDKGVGFSSLVEKMLQVDGDFRLRISSLEPDRIDEHFLDLFSHPRMAPHLHLCMQSGSERILLQMRRQYTASEYRRITERLLTRYPDFNLTTDCIVGFPGETDDDFQATCNMIESVGFSHVHTFPYSRRAGTRAERMPDQVPESVKKERGRLVRDLGYEGKLRYRERMAGKTERLLVEQIQDGYALGYTEHYVPVEVKAPDPEHSGNLRNQFLEVRLDPFCPPKQRNPESDLRMSATLVGGFHPVR
ncbi:MAG: radical SAM protein, partial [Spirochaetaceae bacterium]